MKDARSGRSSELWRGDILVPSLLGLFLPLTAYEIGVCLTLDVCARDRERVRGTRSVMQGGSLIFPLALHRCPGAAGEG